MFFMLSKVIWFFLQPSSLIVIALVLSLVIRRTNPAASTRLAASACVVLVLAMVFPLGSVVMHPLESRFPQKKFDDLDRVPDGIVVLGGAEDIEIIANRGVFATNERAERVIEGLRLARHFPNARVLVNNIATHAYYIEMGISQDRVLLEERSRNTFENAMYGLELSAPKPGENWLLVTSAFHMARAIGCFRQVGFPVQAWPVDFRTRRTGNWLQLTSPPSKGLQTLDLASKEWVGLLVYRLTGRLGDLFPKPQ